jgi:hypothetical protein
MTRPAASSFDRLRPRTPHVTGGPTQGTRLPPSPTDGEGRRALFSVDEPGVAAFGSVSIECSSCREVSVLAFRQAVRVAVPSVYLPVIRGRYPAWLHCPACSDWTWTRVRVRL